MFKKAKAKSKTLAGAKPVKTRETIPTIITSDVHMLGNIVSDGAVDFSGNIDGNIRCETLTLRECGIVKGEVTANNVFIQGTVKGLIRAKNVNLLASCHVEGIIIHEQLAIEDGAFVDGKFKRSDRATTDNSETATNTSESSGDSDSDNASEFMANASNSVLFGAESQPKQASPRPASNVKVLENIRLIR